MINPAGPTPLYRQLYELIRDRIREGEYLPDAAIPTEDQLGIQFQVSRVTVRRALQLLSNEGLLVRQQGRGTFVASVPVLEESLGALRGFAEMMLEHPEQSMEVLSLEAVPASPEVAEQLAVGKGANVVQIRRRHRIGRSVVAVAELYLPDWLGGRLSFAEVGRAPIYTLIARYSDERIQRATQKIGASAATDEVAELLGVAPGSPLLLVRRTTYAVAALPLEYIRLYHIGGRHELVLELAREGQ